MLRPYGAWDCYAPTGLGVVPEVVFVELDFVAFEKRGDLGVEGVAAVMVFLRVDVDAYGLKLGMAHAEGGVSFLPSEMRVEFLAEPGR